MHATDELIVKHIPDSPMWEVIVDFQRHGHIVPAGFKTNFGSIPALLKGIIDDDDPRFLEDFVLHDFNYTEAKLTRVQCDEMLRDAIAKKDKVLALLVFEAVRIGGGSHYGKKCD